MIISYFLVIGYFSLSRALLFPWLLWSHSTMFGPIYVWRWFNTFQIWLFWRRGLFDTIIPIVSWNMFTCFGGCILYGRILQVTRIHLLVGYYVFATQPLRNISELRRVELVAIYLNILMLKLNAHLLNLKIYWIELKIFLLMLLIVWWNHQLENSFTILILVSSHQQNHLWEWITKMQLFI